MKVIRLLIVLLLGTGLLAGCAVYAKDKDSEKPITQQISASAAENESVSEAAPPAEVPAPPTQSKVLVAYFSCTGNTATIAEMIAQHTGADQYRITPQTPYIPADLDYGDSSSRTTTEQNDPTARPAIDGAVAAMENYDTIFLGYPIWWGQAPKIISTFLESYDFGGKTIVPFCTSGSSGVGSSDTNLHALCTDSVRWLPGKRFAASDTQEVIAPWIDDLEIGTSNTFEQGDN